jgi:trigger factor
MQVSVETTGTLGRRVTVTVPAERMEEGVNRRLRELTRTARMDGFRPGKVPLKIIEARYGASVVGEVARDLIDSSLRDALGQEGLKPAGGPSVEPRTIERGRDLEYVVDLEVFPEIAAVDLAGVRIERPVVNVVDEDVEQTLERMRRQRV